MKKLETRHWVFLGLFIVVLASMLSGYSPEINVSRETRLTYDYIDSLPAGSILMFSFDHEASALPEIQPLARALLRHAFRKGHRLIGLALLAEGTTIGNGLMEKTARECGKVYGRDYVYLGFKPQVTAAILSMGESLSKTFPKDYQGHRYEDIEMLKAVNNYTQSAGVISITDGSLTVQWIEYGHARFGVTVTAAMTAAMITSYDPYVASGQLHGLVGGLRGAAEYESLIGTGGGGKRGMLAQTASHLYVIGLIAVGNLLHFMARRRRGSR